MPRLDRIMECVRKLRGLQTISHLQMEELAVAPASVPGTMFYRTGVLNIVTEFSDVIIQSGEELQMPIVNKAGVDILNGQPVSCAGSQGQRVAVVLPNNTDENTEHVLGLATHDIANNQNGRITIFGAVRDVPIPPAYGWNVGDALFVNGSPGQMVNVMPLDAGIYIAHIGIVTKSHPVNGEISVNVFIRDRIAGATRPTTFLRVGRSWFDTVLGYEIWWNGTNWVNSAGTSV